MLFGQNMKTWSW